MSFMIPKTPNVAQPVSPLLSVQAEQARQAAGDAAIKAEVQSGRASTIHAGNDIAYAQAGAPLMGPGPNPKKGASRALGY